MGALQQRDVFHPAKYSLGELRFMLDWVGKPPQAALHKGVPKGVNPTAIRECLARLYELQELQAHQGVAWAGEESVRDSIVRYLSWQEKTLEIQRRGGPRHASQFAWDGKSHKPYKYAPGADSGDLVQSEILDTGEYRSFAVNLKQPFGQTVGSIADVAPWLQQVDLGKPQAPDEVLDEKADTGDVGHLTCSICKKTFEYKQGARTSYLSARSQMANHLRTAKVKVDRHLTLLRKAFNK